VKRSSRGEVHPLFRGVFEDWLARAEVLSALPDAPVVPDDPPRRRLTGLWARLRRHRAKSQRPAPTTTACVATSKGRWAASFTVDS
jgi:hypothetical protein